VIHLDANYLILGGIESSPQNGDLKRWLSRGEAASTSAVAWMEFVTGPASPEVIKAISHVIEDRIVPIGRDEAELAARLFNILGRKRTLRYDCLIAATAIQSNARLATANRSDFASFEAHGLELA
jgi:predicted nucleic acid-binding protein